jgi:hypothetical protein
MNVGLAQQNAPFQNLTNYANLLAGIKAPNTVTQQTQMAPLTQAATIANTLQGTGSAGGLGSLLFGSAAKGTPGTSGYVPAQGGLFGNNGITGVKNSISNFINGNGTGAVPIDTSQGVQVGNSIMSYGSPVTGTGANGGAGAGQVLGTDGKVYNDPTYGTGNTNTTANTDYTDPNSGYTTSTDPRSEDYSSGV